MWFGVNFEYIWYEEGWFICTELGKGVTSESRKQLACLFLFVVVIVWGSVGNKHLQFHPSQYKQKTQQPSHFFYMPPASNGCMYAHSNKSTFKWWIQWSTNDIFRCLFMKLATDSMEHRINWWWLGISRIFCNLLRHIFSRTMWWRLFIKCLLCTYIYVALTVYMHFHYGYYKPFCRVDYVIPYAWCCG